MNALTSTDVFPYIRNNRICIGYNNVKTFLQPDGTLQNLCFVIWYTNLRDTTVERNVRLTKRFVSSEYQVFNNYDGINCDRILDIPGDYSGMMGVPITFIHRYNPKQFEILGATGYRKYDIFVRPTRMYINPVQHKADGTCCCGGKVNNNAAILLKQKPMDKVYYTADNADGYLTVTYSRLLIRRRIA